MTSGLTILKRLYKDYTKNYVNKILKVLIFLRFVSYVFYKFGS